MKICLKEGNGVERGALWPGRLVALWPWSGRGGAWIWGRGGACLATQQFRQMIGKTVPVGGGASQEAGGSRAAVGAGSPAAMRRGEGQGQSRSGRVRGALSSPGPALVGESVGWALPLALALLPLGDEGLPLSRLGVGAWVTKAALYPLGAGAVTWRRGEDIISARG